MSIPVFALAGALSAALFTVPASEPVAHAAPVFRAQDAAQLVPSDATIVFRVDSLGAMQGLMGELAALAQEEFGGEEMSDFLSGEVGLPGDLGKLARDQPAYVVLSISMAGPQRTFVVPTTDAAALTASMGDATAPGGAPWTTAVSGGYVGISQLPGYASAVEPSELVSGLVPGTFSMRVDMAGLIGTFRPLIEMGLEQAELQMDQIAEMQDTPFDIAPLLETYLDFTWDMIDSADRFDMAFGVQDGALDSSIAFGLLEGSPLADYGSDAQVDMTAFPGVIMPDSSVTAVVGADWESLMAKMEPMMDSLLEMYPEPLASSMTQYMESLKATHGLMGPVVTTSGNFGGDGMIFAYYLSSEKPDELVSGLSTAMTSFSNPELGIVIGEGVSTDVAGKSVVTFPMEFDFEKLSNSIADEDLPADQAELMTKAMASLYGDDGMKVSMASSGSNVVVAMGGNDEYLGQALAGLEVNGGGAPAPLQHALKQCAGSSFAFAYSIDFGRMMEQMGSLMTALAVEDDELDELPTSPLPIAVWGAIKKDVWTAGARTNLSDLQRFMDEGNKMAEARRARWEKELEADIEPTPEEVEEDEGGR